MVGGIAAILIAIWFYRSALAAGKSPLPWVFVGFVSYYLPALLWTMLVTPDLRDMVEHSQSAVLAIVARFGYIVVGILCATLVRAKALGKSEGVTDE
jgi:hypothetical protein